MSSSETMARGMSLLPLSREREGKKKKKKRNEEGGITRRFRNKEEDKGEDESVLT